MLAASLVSCTACSESAEAATAAGDGDVPTNGEFQIQYTTPVPSEFFQAASQQGAVEVLWYDSKDYTSSARPATHKPAYVYLPYGYDPTQKYDIIYLLHGWTGTAEQYFGLSSWPQMKNLFDNLIQRGLTRPFIAVSPTWDKDNQSKDWGESTQEAAGGPPTSLSNSQAPFSQEYVNDLIPAVETHYSTYLESPTEAGILASRQHRAIGGFSLGSITTWYIFEQAFPYSKWYLPMSGDNWSQGMYGGQYYPDETAQFLADLVNKSPYKNDFYVWYACGSEDVRLPQSHNQALAMAKLTDTFNAKNFSYHMKESGHHDFNAVWEFCYHALQFFFPPKNAEPMTNYYNRQSLISDVINDPDFGNWGRLILPANTSYWSGTTLEDLDLTWYNGIDPDKTVEIVNYIKAHHKEVFIDIYTEAEKQADPEKRNTGLFFFKAQAPLSSPEGDTLDGQAIEAPSGAVGGASPFAICNAGGGHVYVGAMHDSFPHALEISKQGLNAFALIYRPDWEPSDQDLARALTYIYDHADELGVSRDGYSLWGGSAGARMAADMSRLSHMRSSTGRADIPQAAACIMQYTGYTTVTSDYAPTYACCGTSDGIASWRTMQSRLDQLSALGIPTEFHSYNGLPHGFGLGTGTVAEGWINDAIRFWNQQRSGSTRISQTRTSDGTKPQGIYSLNGTRRDTLRRGVNIVDGRKVVKQIENDTK